MLMRSCNFSLCIVCAFVLVQSYALQLQNLASKLTHKPTASVPLSGIVDKVSRSLQDKWYETDVKTKSSMERILKLYRDHGVDSSAFNGVDGYGHGDLGREKFDDIVASLMGAEAALVRLQMFSGTHAISTALFGALRPGQSILGVSGHPYDTLEEVLGLRNSSTSNANKGSLRDWGIGYHEIGLVLGESEGGGASGVKFDLATIDAMLDKDSTIKVIHVQRSCGYQFRPSIPIAEIKTLCSHIKSKYNSQGRDLVIFVDNCYGELVEEQEPCHVGADLVAGSLIKNLGGTLAPCGGYIAGKRHLVEAAEAHLSAPGVEGGATLGQYRKLFQGLFMAPSIVGESLKGAELLAQVMQTQLGYPCYPPPEQFRTDIVQAVQLGSRMKLIAFCEAVQRKSPVGAHIRPIPGYTPGYGHEVIFADGTFIEGSTLELSADGPLREPYVAYSQGCTHWTHWAIVLEEVLRDKAFLL